MGRLGYRNVTIALPEDLYKELERYASARALKKAAVLRLALVEFFERHVVEVKCPHCGHEWKYRGKLMAATCPSCLRRFRLHELVRWGGDE